MKSAAAYKHPRNVAKREGAKFYITGKPCRRCGSTGKRYAICGRCCACQTERNRKYSSGYHKEYKRAQLRKFHDANPTYELERGRRRAGLPTPTRPCPETCERCGRHASEQTRKMHLDHCHETGAFRGWLCNMCNLGIGNLGDTEQDLLEALNYIRASKGKAPLHAS